MRPAWMCLTLLGLVAESRADTPTTEANADLNVAMTFADGRKVEGHVIRVERGQDWYAEQGWNDAPGKLVLTLDGGGTEVDRAWKDLATIEVKYGAKSDVDCMYESEFTPWMYSCTLKTATTVKTTDGKTWTAGTRNKWRFTFENGVTEEFFINKLPIRRQAEATEGHAGSEDHALYADLQAELWRQAAKAVTRIEVKAAVK